MMIKISTIFSLLLAHPAKGFVARPAFHTKLLALSGKVTSDESLSKDGKFYQLEEYEDKEKSLTELVLHDDKTVSLMSTDGPMPVSAHGTWTGDHTGFQMNLVRRYESGMNGSDMGEFSFEVARTFFGDVYETGDRTTSMGVVKSQDEVMGEMEVGYFVLLDTTVDRVLDIETSTETELETELETALATETSLEVETPAGTVTLSVS